MAKFMDRYEKRNPRATSGISNLPKDKQASFRKYEGIGNGEKNKKFHNGIYIIHNESPQAIHKNYYDKDEYRKCMEYKRYVDENGDNGRFAPHFCTLDDVMSLPNLTLRDVPQTTDFNNSPLFQLSPTQYHDIVNQPKAVITMSKSCYQNEGMNIKRNVDDIRCVIYPSTIKGKIDKQKDPLEFRVLVVRDEDNPTFWRIQASVIIKGYANAEAKLLEIRSNGPTQNEDGSFRPVKYLPYGSDQTCFNSLTGTCRNGVASDLPELQGKTFDEAFDFVCEGLKIDQMLPARDSDLWSMAETAQREKNADRQIPIEKGATLLGDDDGISREPIDYDPMKYDAAVNRGRSYTIGASAASATSDRRGGFRRETDDVPGRF